MLAPSWTDEVTAVATAFAAVGTVATVAVALFRDELEDWWKPASASLRFDSSPDVTQLATPFGSELVCMYNLRIRNTSPRRVLHRCGVVLDELEHPSADRIGWAVQALPVALALRWAPFESRPLEIDLRPDEEATLNLLWFRIPPRAFKAGPTPSRVQPVLAGEPANFQGNLTSAGAIRYHVAFRADEIRAPLRATFEVEWNGEPPGLDKSVDSVLTVRRLAG